MPSLEKIKVHIIITNILYGIIWSIIFLSSRKKFKINHNIYLISYFIPIILIIYNTINNLSNIKYFNQKSNVNNETCNNKFYTLTIPISLFIITLSFLIEKDLLNIISPILLMSFFIGIIVPNMIPNIINNLLNAEKNIYISFFEKNLNYMCYSFSFSYIISCLIKFFTTLI